MANNPLRPDITNSGLTDNTLESEKLQNSNVINNKDTQSEQTQNNKNQNTQLNQINNPLRPDINKKDLASAQLAEEMGLKRLKSYKEIEDPSEDLANKYKSMLEAREKYNEDDIDISKGLPSLEEMFTDDLAYEFYKEIVGDGKTPGSDKDALDAVFYAQAPPSKLGYNLDGTFTLEYTGQLSSSDIESKKNLNKVDGDTFIFDMSQLNDGGEPFTMDNGLSYDSFADYCVKNNLDSSELTVREVGIQCQEIPHYTVQAMKKSNIVSMTLGEAKKKGALYQKYKDDGSSRSNDDVVDFYKNGNSYTEIIKDYNIPNSDSSNLSSDYEYKVVLTKDDSTAEGIVDGYKAQEELANLLARSSKIRLKLDMNSTVAQKTTGKYKTYYNHWWHVFDAIDNMIDQWYDATSGEIPLSRLSFGPFGVDNYGRFLGEIYCLVNENGKEVWVNANKYVLCKTELTEANPSSGSPEMDDKYGDVSNSFKLWEYDRDNIEYLDSFLNQTEENYTKRIELHKEVTGIDFTKFRNCTLFLGDTLFLIPPTSIRNVSSVEYEKHNILRGKGSMVKGLTNREQYLEIDLYFYDYYGINGLEYIHTFPNGQQMTYFLDGLRSLIAQFHVAPYLPIENQYINDILGIETVSLVNINIRTVEGYPRLLQATLTLRDFNYRIFMPDLPIDYGTEDISEISEMNPIFAKCIHWEVFRYYYQRLLLRGNQLDELEYGTKEYFEKVYNNKITLKPAAFCDYSDEVSFYVPDENWLKNALEIKKERDYTGQNPINIELSDEGKKFLSDLASVCSSLVLDSNAVQAIKDNCALYGPIISFTNKDIFGSKILGTTLTSNNPDVTDLEYAHKLIDPLVSNMEQSGVLTYVQTDETCSKDDKSLTYNVIFKINKNSLSATDLIDVKEVLKDMTDSSNISGILDNGQLKISIKLQAGESGNITSISQPVSEKQIIETLAGQYSATDEPVTTPENGTGDNDRNSTIADEYDYRNPAAMKFVPWLERVPVHSLACGMSNHFTEMTLKIMDGSAPQYMGSSDISIELRIITEDAVTVSMLNVLPTHAINIAKQYRRILNCWPMRIKNSTLQLMGINEVLIDSVQIENMDGYPGVYDIRMRLTSVDRFMRQRETLKALESNKITTGQAEAEISDYFDIEDTLSYAETYPDLDIPSLYELSQLGYKFIKYNNSKNIYPDPDFYMLYGYEYTAKIIKKNIKDIYLNKLLHCEENEYTSESDNSGRPFMYMQDHSGQLIATNLTSTKGLEITDMNDVAEIYTKAILDAAEIGEEDISKKERKGEDKEYDPTVATTGKALIYATLADIQEGWEIKSGWFATMAPVSTNLSVENCELSNIKESDNEDETNIYATSIFEIRKKAIELIDKILEQPMSLKDLSYSVDKPHTFWYKGSGDGNTLKDPIGEAVDCVFKENADGAALLKLLCPYGDIKSINGFVWKNHDEYYNKLKKARPLNYIQHFLHAAACTLSGDEPKRGQTGFLKDGNEYTDYGARQYYSHENVYKDDSAIPYCLCENAGKPMTAAKSKEQALEYGVRFGMCQISKEKKSEILNRIKPESQVDYLGGGKTFKIYKDYKNGFIDPYYNKLDEGSDELKEYIERITMSPAVNCVAFIRVVLMYLRKQIIDGYLISEIDLLGQDSETIKKMFSDTDKTWGEFNQAMKDTPFWESFRSGVLDLDNDGDEEGDWMTWVNPVSWIDGVNRYFQNVDRKIDANEIEDKTDKELDGEFMLKLIEDMNESFAKSYCARLIFPFVEAATQLPEGPNKAVKNYFANRKYEQLNILSNSLLTATSASNEMITKYLLILKGSVTNIDSSNVEPGTTSNAQKLMNTIAREAFSKLSEDPQAYVLHSFYDMLTNDKRGRLVRAFPTYYVVFIDEGRKIGSWKLFDNFYNMSAISDLTVTKSRKIPTDTCSFTMTNMFNSYASEYDNTTKQAYTDVYSIRDVFTSIFTPEVYITKEDALARRKEVQDTTVLQPGVRLHIRMGYGSNAGRLPVVFNGKIAEIDVGDAVTIIGQGDGAELVNPLNALGETDATNIVEAQAWTTICKDFRGSMARGGLSPRNLLSQILTAQHGGLWKTVIRNWSDDRYYGDNPFGIYHFGDVKFNKIFTEGEVVQNLYEVVDGTLLAGANELYPNSNTALASPTINTNISDKTFWDLLTMCAYSGVGYIGAIRDFGFRSTVFLGKPNHYYAYGYTKTDGKYIEKRKPFQQFHHYDSYTDIIFNSIKASDKNIKTNAVGVWEGTDVWWGQEQKTCGPLYLDINIYPEHQKSMTVDTGLIASGNGGIDIPFITHFSEEWNVNAETNKVNKALAERITGNTLRETLKNMYLGEICVIGDPSVKPYDRISITDSYEDMVGQMEVEAVVYSMNFNTGFTTTIYPDLIVRMDDQLEPAVQSIAGNIVASFLATVTSRCAIIGKLASVESKVLRSAAQMLGPLIKKYGEARAVQIFANTGIGKALGITTSKASSGIKGILEAVKASGGNPYVIAAMIIIATTVFCLTKNAKSFLTRWIKSIQMLDVYPIFKNGRPFIAGMNGHKGSVVGYEYTEEDCDDSMQGMIVKCVENVSDWGWGIGKALLSPFLDHEEYQKTVLNWSNTLKYLETDYDVEDMTQTEGIIQNVYSAVSKEFNSRSRNNTTQTLRSKYRLTKFDTNGGTDKTYLKYRNLGVSPYKVLDPTLISGTEGTDTAIYSSSLFTNKNILSLYPVEDDPEIKEALLKSHSNKVKFSLAHSKGNRKDNLSFESGSRVIRYFIEDNPSSALADYPIMDLPMIQEDAMVVLKYIINDENLKKKDVVFMSGARINDTRSWKNTGFAFELQCKDGKALEKAAKSVKEKTQWLYKGESLPLFNYQMSEDICVFTVYPEASPLRFKKEDDK